MHTHTYTHTHALEEKDTSALLQRVSRWPQSSARDQTPELWADRGNHDAPSARKTREEERGGEGRRGEERRGEKRRGEEEEGREEERRGEMRREKERGERLFNKPSL